MAKRVQYDPRNANKGTPRGRKLLAQSLKSYGAGRSILADKHGVTVAGNKTLAAAHELKIPTRIIKTDGKELIVVQRTDLDLKSRKGQELAIADNRVSELDLSWNPEVLSGLDADLSKFWNEAELRKTLGKFAPPEVEAPEPQLDKAEKLRKKWKTARGQIWEIGEHRLMCGDGITDLASLMGARTAQMVMGDPPYNVKYTGGSTNDSERIDSYADDKDDAEYTEWLGRILSSAANHSDDKAALHLWYASAKIRCILDAMVAAAWSLRTIIVWNKLDAHYGALGAQYKHRYEPMIYAHKNGESPRWYGASNECTVWDEKQPSANVLHPTIKPLALYSRSLSNHTAKGDTVLECFSGSGTTMCAAQALSRICYGMEIEPKYVAVALERISEMGLKPELLHSKGRNNETKNAARHASAVAREPRQMAKRAER